MKYAIQELENVGRITKGVNCLSDFYEECYNVASKLKERSFVNCSNDIVNDLVDILKRVELGLSEWTKDSFIDAKKRQELKKKDLIEAINFLRPECNYCRRTSKCEGSYPEGCFYPHE